MSSSKIDIDEAIYKLLQGLRQKGYSIGTDAYIKTTEIFFWFLKEKKGDTIEEFAPYLAPVICKSIEEQTNFTQVFQELFAKEFTIFQTNFYNEIKSIEDQNKKKKRKILSYAGLTIIAISILGGLFFFWKYLNSTATPNYKNLLTQPLYVNRNDAVLLCENPIFKNLKDSSRFTIEYNIHKAKQTHKGFQAKHNFEQYGKDTISVKIKSIKPGLDSTVEFSEIFVGPEKLTITPEKDDIERGDENIFTANIDSTLKADFYWEVKKENDTTSSAQNNTRLKGNPIKYTFKEEGNYSINVKYDTSKNDFPKTFPEEKLSGYYYQKVTTPGLQLEAAYTPFPETIKTSVNKWWVLGLSILSLMLLYFAVRTIKKVIVKISKKSNTDIFTGNKPPYDLTFSNKNKNISYTYDLLRLSNHLKKRIDRLEVFLDISKTIRQSIVNRGFPTPGYSQKQETRPCLFLIDQAYKNSQQVKLFSYLAVYLIQHQVKLDFFYYYQTPDKFYIDEDGPRLTLETLKDRYYNCALIFFTDGTNFPQYNAPTLKESITIGFAYWQYRLLVTPVTYNDWGRNEKLLSTFFNVIPADVVGLLELIRAMDTDSSDTKIMQGQFYTYGSKYIDFNTVKGLQEYLDDNELFQWLCALAIHPKIYWEVILEIGKAIVVNPTKINYETLLKLARIQWLHEGNFPTKTRLELLKALTKDNEIKARDAFLKMLDEIPLADDRFSYEEKQISRYANSFVLFATGIPKYTTDKNIQDGEENFISLYKNENIADNAFKIYIEKKQTEQGKWDTPITSKNENTGIEKYIDNKERAQINGIKSERLKRNKKFVRYLSGAIAALAILGYIFSNKDAVAKSGINEYLKLTNTTLLIEKSIYVGVDTSECFRKLITQNKDAVAVLEIIKGSSVVTKKTIKLSDNMAEPLFVKNVLSPNYKMISYRLIINEQVFKKEMPLLAGNYTISLTGCQTEHLNITYNTGYNEDTTAVFSVFKRNRDFIKMVPANGYNKTSANRVIFDSAIRKNEIFTYGDNLIKAGFPLKNVSIRNRQTAKKNIVIDGLDSLNKMPNFTSENLRKLLFPDSIHKSSVNIFYASNVSASQIAQVKNCLGNRFNVSTLKNIIPKTSVNLINYYRESFKDSAKIILTCLQKYFPDKVFELAKTKPERYNRMAADIFFINDIKELPSILLNISDESLRSQTGKLKRDLESWGFPTVTIGLTKKIIRNSIEYYDPTQLNNVNYIKRTYSAYFRGEPTAIRYVPDANKKYINVEIKKLSEPIKEKIAITDTKFPKSVYVNEKFNIAIIITANNINNGLPTALYNGKICIKENNMAQQKNANNACESFSFKTDSRTIISKELAATYAPGNYPVRVTIEQLKIDTIIGYLTVKENIPSKDKEDIKSTKSLCDTFYSYVGSSDDYTVFKGQAYDKSSLKRKGIELTLVQKDPKFISLNITSDKCPLIKLMFYPGETKTVTLCDDTKITLKSVNAENTSTNRQNNWALFDVIVCKYLSNLPLKNIKKSDMKSKSR